MKVLILFAACCSFPFCVALVCCNKFDFCICCTGSYTAVPHCLSEEKGESLSEGLSKAGTHKAIHNGVDRWVGIWHAVGPCLDLICGIIDLKVGVERLKEDKDLNWTPADGEEHHNDYDHFGNLTSDGNGSLWEQMHLKLDQLCLWQGFIMLKINRSLYVQKGQAINGMTLQAEKLWIK